MINVNLWTVIIHLVLFLIMVVLLNRLLFQPLFAVMDQRKSRVNDNRKRAEELSAVNEELVREYRSRLEQAKKEAAQEKETLRRVAAAEEDQIIKAAREQAGNMVADLRERIAGEYREAEGRLRKEAENMGREIAAKMLGRPV